MNTAFLKKTGLVTSFLARELMTSVPGDRCPTIAYCTEAFHVSRGTVQEAFATLENSGGLQTVKHGKGGSIIEKLDKDILLNYTNLNSLTATMPIPLNGALSGLATAICRNMIDSPLPFTFAFIAGANKRVQALLRMDYDFIVVSTMTARSFLPQYPDLEIALDLSQCLYSHRYVLCINRPNATGLEDGMVVACDKNCTDQVLLTKSLAKGKNITIYDTPYISCHSLLVNKEIDAAVYRSEEWVKNLETISRVSVETTPFSIQDMNTPVILVNKNNYGVSKLLRYLLDPQKIHEVQKLVLEEKMLPQFY